MKKTLVVLACAAVVTIAPVGAQACTCLIRSEDYETLIEEADAIFEGVALFTHEKQIPEEWDVCWGDAETPDEAALCFDKNRKPDAMTTFEILKAWKGSRAGERVLVGHDYQGCAVFYDSGQIAVVVAHRSQGILKTDMCSEQMASDPEFVAILQRTRKGSQ